MNPAGVPPGTDGDSPEASTAGGSAVSWPGLLGYLLVGIVLRALLSAVNREANDDHLVVMREIIARNWAAPGRDVCWEAYHAKLYHYASAVVYAIAQVPVGRETAYLANFVAMAAGLGTLGVLLRSVCVGLGGVSWQPSVRVIGFGFFALWPALIVISSQATNDSFVICFCSASLYFLHRFLRAPCRRSAAGAIGFMILAVSSKASGWIFFLVSVAVIVVKVAVERGARRTRLLAFAGVCIAAFLTVACLQEPYRGYLRDYGTPFKGAKEEDNARQPFPHVFQKTQYGSPGLLSLWDSFFKFRFVDMLACPYITNDHSVYPQHRTCFWSQLYGRAFFTRFDQWPPGWQNTEPATVAVGRLCLLLGLLPAATLLVGIGVSVRTIVAGLRREGLAWLARDHDWIFPVFVFAFLGMVAMFAVLYRGYSWMKVIYLLPALLGIFKLHLDGLNTICIRFPSVGRWNLYAHCLLFFAFNVDTIRLIHQLSTGR
jgi:hypothetical protein